MSQPTTIQDTAATPAIPAFSAPAAHSMRGWILALLASSLFSMAPPIARGAIQSGVDSTTLVMLRLLLATVLTSATILLTNRQQIWIGWRGVGYGTVAGFINGVGMLLFFWALERVAASITSMMIALSPLFVLSLLWLGGERFTYRHIIRMVLGMVGIYFLVGSVGEGAAKVDPIGLLLLLVAVICFSVQIVMLQWFMRPYRPQSIALWGLVGMTTVVGIGWFFTGESIDQLAPSTWGIVVILAFFCTYLSRLSYISAVAIIGSGQAALLAPFETLLTVIWSLLFLNERLSLSQWFGGLLILLSALLAIQRLGRAKNVASQLESTAVEQ